MDRKKLMAVLPNVVTIKDNNKIEKGFKKKKKAQFKFRMGFPESM